MKKNELIDAIARRTKISRSTVREVLEAAADSSREALAAGGEVFLFGLGKLSVSSRSEKRARNLRTGETVIVPARRVAVYRQSTSVEESLNGRGAPAGQA